VSLIGTWMQTTGQSWLVLQLTKSAWALGVVGALQFLPVLFFTLFGGVLADRLPKRRMLLITQSMAAILAFVLWLLVFTHTVQLWHVFILAALLGISNAFDMPTRQSFVVEMVGRKDLPNAIALNSSVFNMARIVGPGIAGLVIAWFGEAPLFLLNAISFIPVLAGLAMINPAQLHTQATPTNAKHQSAFKSLGEGFVYIWNTPAILMIIAIVGLVSLFGINFNVTLPLMATDVLNVGAEGFGFISSAFGLGALLAALWLAWVNKRPAIKQILFSAILFGIGEALFAVSHWYLLSLVLVAMVGFLQIAFSAVANSTLQTLAPDHLRGRIMSMYMLVFAGSTPLGNLLTGAGARSFGVSATLLVSALLSLAVALIGWFLHKPAGKSVKQTASVLPQRN
ncbi:MAG: MFS transporter, partial [Ktedonobacteraceae bacterium]|nr:MFS transporter [Ktedonobacteraceae bacterium]